MVAQLDSSAQAHDSKPVSPDTWRRLYELAAKVRAMEPWMWMEETDLFGIRDAGSEEILFVSVMGLLGEYHAVAVYPGAKAVNEFWRMQDAPGRDAIADTLSAMHYVHAAFGRKSELTPAEKRRIADMGLTFKGATAWPRFLSFRPGWFPWVVDAREARWLALGLEQLLDVAPRVQENRRLLGHGGPDHRYLVRVRPPDCPQAGWVDAHEACLPPATTVRVTIPNSLVDAYRAVEPSGATVELDVFPSYMPVRERDERPRLPFMMLAVEADSGFIMGFELLMVEGAIEDMWAQVPAKFLEIMKRNRLRPAVIAMRTPWLFTVMEGVCRDLQMEIRPDPELAALSEARESLTEFNRR